MKKYLHILCLIFAVCVACTRNNGDIGPWFGTWKLSSITIDGQPEAYNADPDILWKFQSDIICMVRADDNEHTATPRWGTWSHSGNMLSLDFTYTDNNGDGEYTPFPVTHLQRGVTAIDIVKLSGSEIRLRWIDHAGQTIEYTLNKWG